MDLQYLGAIVVSALIGYSVGYIILGNSQKTSSVETTEAKKVHVFIVRFY